MHAEENQPDISLLDIKMKGKMDGMYTAASFQHKNIPAFFLIANADGYFLCRNFHHCTYEKQYYYGSLKKRHVVKQCGVVFLMEVFCTGHLRIF